jgi:hypothetical protein
VVEEYKVVLLLGRTLAFEEEPAGLEVSMIHTMQYKDAQGRTRDVKVDLLFPCTRRSVARVMEKWWEHKVRSCAMDTLPSEIVFADSLLAPVYPQGGRPMTKADKAAAKTGPTKRAMPLRFYTLVLVLIWWENELMAALVDLK